MTNSPKDQRAPDDEPTTRAEPQGDQPGEDLSALLELKSLRSYFDDFKGEHARSHFSDWLRLKAHAILNEEAGAPEDLFTFAKNWLNERLLFGPAAHVCALSLNKYGDASDLLSNKIRQQQALATYKDEETPPQRRYEAALAILKGVKPPAPDSGATQDEIDADEAETWGLRGAVHRRLFDLDGDLTQLHQALNCYREAHGCDNRRDTVHFEGYGGINAAFLLDSLAFRLESIGEGPILKHAARDARAESASLRELIIDRLRERLRSEEEQKHEWLCETLAGACFGLGLSRWTTDRNGPEGAQALLEDASLWTKKATATKRADWKIETTHAQWLRLAYLNEPPAAGNENLKARIAGLEAYWAAAACVINAFRKSAGGVTLTGEEMARRARIGKVGLALSGGGFRASFYHIGVLARLAEADVLRHVDVLSTVSGGSIVGAHYYLLLRDLLEKTANPSCKEYVKLVQDLEKQFSSGVRKNLRMRGLSNPWVTLKLLICPGYTRSDRMAELYDENFYSPKVISPQVLSPKQRLVRMDSLRITPQGEVETFNPRFSNWRRSARVPALLINATCLNTGHSWHFTANWMGEPPELIGDVVDKNERLRRMSYREAGRPFDSLTLGFAVAASACVPGIFEPIQLRGLYPGRLVRLVDGGVHDNQGVDALIGQGCDFILCSDASGQMGDENTPPNGPVSVPNRSMSVLMKRIREGEYSDLDTRTAAPDAGRNLFFVHLKMSLPAEDVDWVNCKDPTPPKPRAPAPYGVDHEIQRYLSDIRTDLDCFSEVEASALMTSGYLMASTELERCNARISSRREAGAFGAFDLNVERQEWGFMKLKDKMALAPDANDIVREDLCRQLRAGHSLFFRNLKLVSRRVYVAGASAALVFLIAVVSAACGHYGEILPWLAKGWRVSHWIFAVAAVVIILAGVFRIWFFESFFALVGLIGSNIHLHLGPNHWSLKRGRLDRLLDLN
jgi:predicted acylesterase/phospholipase RssA